LAVERVQRKLAAILSADMVGYSRLVALDEADTLSRLNTLRRELIDPTIASHSGRIFKLMGDGALVEFASAVDAVTCAIEIQRQLRERAAAGSEANPIQFRMGINVGDIIIDGEDILGDGVNIAARIEGVAEPGGISISEDAWRHVQGKVTANFVDAGEQNLKNIARPVRVYRVEIGTGRGTQPVTPALTLPDKPSIAVLPFQNMSGDPKEDYFADGVVEDIITALSRFSSLFVIARNSSFTYRGKHVDIRQVGRELGVRYVLEGSIRKSGDRLRVTAQLIDAGTGAHIWADTYNRMVADVFDVQDDITRNVVGAIEPSIKEAEIERAQRKKSNDLNAYDFYLRALPELYSATREGNDKAIELLNRALLTDPNFAAAATAIGGCLLWRIGYGWSDIREAAPRVRKYAELALRFDKENSDALALLARGTAAMRQYDEALLLSERAVTSNPNSAFAWTNRGWVYLYLEQPKVAEELLERALRLSPRDPFNYDAWVGMAIAYVQQELDDRAIDAARKAVHQNPQHAWAYRLLALSLALAGRHDDADTAMKQAMAVDPAFSIAWFQSWNPFIHGNRRYVRGFQLAGFPER
jgi:adenylate cyclase